MDGFLCASGGPLCEGDIEEVEGVLHVFCPWHDYDFDLRTGKSGTSLQVCHQSTCACKKKKKSDIKENIPWRRCKIWQGTCKELQRQAELCWASCTLMLTWCDVMLQQHCLRNQSPSLTGDALLLFDRAHSVQKSMFGFMDHWRAQTRSFHKHRSSALIIFHQLLYIKARHKGSIHHPFGLTLKRTCQQKKSSTFLSVILFNISWSHFSFSFVCFLFWFFCCFWQQKVYEVKLEDGNVYVKHTSHLSLEPFPVDQKSCATTRRPPKDLLWKPKPSFLKLVCHFCRPLLLWTLWTQEVMSSECSFSFLDSHRRLITDRCHGNPTDIKKTQHMQCKITSNIKFSVLKLWQNWWNHLFR